MNVGLKHRSKRIQKTYFPEMKVFVSLEEKLPDQI
jgi:hypothetical protein